MHATTTCAVVHCDECGAARVQMQGSPRLGDPGAAACNPVGAPHTGRSARVWGWLEGAGQLPNVLLRGAGAALGCGHTGVRELTRRFPEHEPSSEDFAENSCHRHVMGWCAI